MKISERKLEKIIFQVGKAIKDEPVEHGAVVNPATGRLLLCKKGTAFEVVFSQKEKDSFKNMIFIHNHPEESPLSGADVVEAFKCKLNKLIVVIKNHFISMKIPDNFSPKILPENFVEEVNQTCKEYYGANKFVENASFIHKYVAYCKIQEGKREKELFAAGIEPTVTEYWDNVWKRFAEGIPGCEYKKKKIKAD